MGGESSPLPEVRGRRTDADDVSVEVFEGASVSKVVERESRGGKKTEKRPPYLYVLFLKVRDRRQMIRDTTCMGANMLLKTEPWTCFQEGSNVIFLPTEHR